MFRNLFDGLFNDFFTPHSYNSTFPNRKNDIKKEHGEDEDGKWYKESYTSPDGSLSYSLYVKSVEANPNPMSNDVDNSITFKKKELKEALNKEDYQKAIKLRDEIKNLEKNSTELKKLQLLKKEAVNAEDFEKAEELNKKISSLK